MVSFNLNFGGVIKLNNFATVILAAGKGTRMKSDMCKVMHRVSSKPLIEWVYNKAKNAGSEKIVMVVGHKKEQVMEYMGEDKLYSFQTEMLGTGHAVMMARDHLEGYDGDVVVLCGDTPLISSEMIEDTIKLHRNNGNSATVVTALLSDPASYGRIVRNQAGDVEKIVEYKDANDEERAISEINSGMYCFNSKDLFLALDNISNDNAQGEYYLTDTIAILKSMGKKVGASIMKNSDEILGVNDRINLCEAQRIKNNEIVTKHMINGVTIVDPQSTYIDDEVEISPDTIIMPNTHLKGNTKIGSLCEIGPNSIITNMEIADNVKVLSSVATDSKIGSGTTVGPFAYIRPNSNIGEKVKIGDFVEIKNSTIDEGTKVSHLTYIGDSDVGKGINFGCGTITVNYDGANKFRTVIEDNAFIGCNTNLVSPVKVGKNAFIAAGSTITEDVDPDSLAIARSRQTVKKDWKRPVKNK